MARSMHSSKFNIFLFIERTKKETKALNQLMFPGYYPTVFVVLPAYVSLIVYFFFRNAKVASNAGIDAIASYQADGIDNFLIAFKVTLLFLAAFLVLYRWSVNLKNGNYGYWLTLGIKREVLYLFVLGTLSLRLILSFLIPFLFLMIITGVTLSFSKILFLILLECVSIVFLVAFSLFLAESIEISELAVSTFVLTYAILFIVQGSSLLYYLRYLPLAEFEYNTSLPIIPLLLSLVGTIIFSFAGYFLHKRHDIEL